MRTQPASRHESADRTSFASAFDSRASSRPSSLPWRRAGLRTDARQSRTARSRPPRVRRYQARGVRACADLQAVEHRLAAPEPPRRSGTPKALGPDDTPAVSQWPRDRTIGSIRGGAVDGRPPYATSPTTAPDETGKVVRWSIEWGGAGQLTLQGVNRNRLKYGDVVRITAHPSRTPNDHKLHMMTMRRTSDNWGWVSKPGDVVD